MLGIWTDNAFSHKLLIEEIKETVPKIGEIKLMSRIRFSTPYQNMYTYKIQQTICSLL